VKAFQKVISAGLVWLALCLFFAPVVVLVVIAVCKS
jgi:hypothetical protein